MREWRKPEFANIDNALIWFSGDCYIMPERCIELGCDEGGRIIVTGQEPPPDLTHGVGRLLGTRSDPDDDDPCTALDVLEGCIAHDGSAGSVEYKPVGQGDVSADFSFGS